MDSELDIESIASTLASALGRDGYRLARDPDGYAILDEVDGDGKVIYVVPEDGPAGVGVPYSEFAVTIIIRGPT